MNRAREREISERERQRGRRTQEELISEESSSIGIREKRERARISDQEALSFVSTKRYVSGANLFPSSCLCFFLSLNEIRVQTRSLKNVCVSLMSGSCIAILSLQVVQTLIVQPFYGRRRWAARRPAPRKTSTIAGSCELSVQAGGGSFQASCFAP